MEAFSSPMGLKQFSPANFFQEFLLWVLDFSLRFVLWVSHTRPFLSIPVFSPASFKFKFHFQFTSSSNLSSSAKFQVSPADPGLIY